MHFPGEPPQIPAIAVALATGGVGARTEQAGGGGAVTNLPKLDFDIELLHARDARLLEEIARLYGPVLKSIFGSMSVDRHHLDDLVQGFWVHLLSRLDRYTGKAPFGPWLVRVAKNYRTSCARREQTEAARTADFDEALGLAAAGALDDEAQRRFLEKAVSEALDRLPDDEREAVVLTILQEKTRAEAADIIGVRPPTVANLVRRALFRLQGEERMRWFHEDL